MMEVSVAAVGTAVPAVMLASTVLVAWVASLASVTALAAIVKAPEAATVRSPEAVFHNGAAEVCPTISWPSVAAAMETGGLPAPPP